MVNKRLEDIGDIFTDEGYDKLKEKQTLTFSLVGERTDYKVVKKYQDEEGNHVLVKKTKLYDPDDVDIVDKNKNA